jgi:hypothetical protein
VPFEVLDCAKRAEFRALQISVAASNDARRARLMDGRRAENSVVSKIGVERRSSLVAHCIRKP